MIRKENRQEKNVQSMLAMLMLERGVAGASVSESAVSSLIDLICRCAGRGAAAVALEVDNASSLSIFSVAFESSASASAAGWMRAEDGVERNGAGDATTGAADTGAGAGTAVGSVALRGTLAHEKSPNVVRNWGLG